MHTHDKYPYPFAVQLLKDRDMGTARTESGEQERWVYVPQRNTQESIAGKIRLVFEPDTLVFADAEKGIIKLSLYPNDEGDLEASGGIYNPKKGKETLLALIDILKYISKVTGKKITYRTLRVNRTQVFIDLLLDTGFIQNGHEFEFSVEPSDVSNHTYPEVDEEINKLMDKW